MNEFIKRRVLNEANYIIKTEDTIRGTSKKFDLSKSAIHQDLSTRLKEIDKNLYEQINCIFKNHNEIKHIRGGEATRKKYKKEKYEK